MATDNRPLTTEEIERFETEMEGNFDGDRTTIEVLLNIISDTSAAAAAFREWLHEAEDHTGNTWNH